MKPCEPARAKIGRIEPPAFGHINRQIPPEPHTAMYVWHKYWSRKTWNVVGEHIARRAEPTPYTILINQVDPVLAKRGLSGALHSGLDVKTVLEESVGKEFELVSARLGGAEGKLWWFADKAFAARLDAVPLTERVEETVFRCLHEKSRVSFAEVWDTVAREFARD